jgi:hypothetical protein
LEEALDRAMWRNRFRGGFGPVGRQNAVNEWMFCLLCIAVCEPCKETNWMHFLSSARTNCHIYTLSPPDDGLLANPKHVDL